MIKTPFTIIAAIDKNHGIGADGKLLVTNSVEMTHFKNTTYNSVVIMGYNTYRSIGLKGLKGRKNIVISSKNDVPTHDDVIVVKTLNEAFKIAELWSKQRRRSVVGFSGYNTLKIFVIGGAKLYADTIKYADNLIISQYDTEYSEADSFFPPIKADEFFKTSTRVTGYGFTIGTYNRIKY